MQALTDTDPHKYPQKLMDYVSVYQFNPWYKYARSYGFYSCTEGFSEDWPCDLDDATCGATSDIWDWSESAKNETEVWKWGNIAMEVYMSSARADGFITEIGSDDPASLNHKLVQEYGAKYKWTHLEMDEQTEFMRFILAFWSKPGNVGVAATGSSPTDPL